MKRLWGYVSLFSLLFVTVLVLSSESVLAQPQGPLLDDKSGSNPNVSPYEALMALYLSGDEPASLDDFDEGASPLTWECAGVLKSAPQTLAQSAVFVQYKLKFSGEPSHGPLFPGTPDRFVTKLVGSSLIGGTHAQDWAEKEELRILDKDLSVEVSEVRGFDPRYFPLSAKIRKVGKYLSFMLTRGSVDEGYYYCWKK